MAYDPDHYDALILVERVGGATFTAEEIGYLLGAPTQSAARTRAQRLKRRGVLPACDLPGDGHTPNRWSKDLVVETLARLRAGELAQVR